MLNRDMDRQTRSAAGFLAAYAASVALFACAITLL
jgi:hypothetical protein